MSAPGHAVVAGAGIGGLAAAVGLRRAGWSVTVLERATQPGEVGAGLSLWPNALKALDALGVGDSIRACGYLQGTGGFRRPDGRWLARSSTVMRERSGVELLVVHRSRLHRELLDGVGGGALHTETTVTDVRQNDTEVVVYYDTPDGPRHDSADLVVGADGLRSVVRARVWPEAPAPMYAGFTAWRGVTTQPVEATDEGGETWGRGAEFGVVPMIDGQVYWFGTANLPEGTTFADDHGEVLRRFGHWHSTIPAVVQATAPAAVLHHDIYHVATPLPRLCRGRVVLLGDAAHAMTPNLGQGACLALEDAATLSLLVRRTGGSDVPGYLQDYDGQRRPRVEHLVKMSARTGRVVQAEHPAAVAVRDVLAAAAPKRLSMRQIARIIGWNPPNPTR